jgi:hypothetical protein
VVEARMKNPIGLTRRGWHFTMTKLMTAPAVKITPDELEKIAKRACRDTSSRS